MAKIRNANPKQSSGGFERAVGNKEMAAILTKAQSTVITNGTELEKIISEKAVLITDLDDFIEKSDKGEVANGSYLCTKSVVKKSKYRMDKHEPDFIAFTIETGKNLCYVVELKDGDSFDTKKALAEKESLRLFVNHLAPQIPFRTRFYICCFNQNDKDRIIAGFKHAFNDKEIMTGKEFSNILGIDYERIVNERATDAVDNFNYIVGELIHIKEIRDRVVSFQRQHISEKEFYKCFDEE